MKRNITLTLVKSLIMESVKNETYQTGEVDKASDQKNVMAAYRLQAGDEDYHLRLLERALYTNVSDLKTLLAEYLEGKGYTSGDNISSSESGDNIIITLAVSDRFNTAMTDPLAKLCSKYIEESMLADWWKPVSKERSALYLQFAEKNLASIRRCFNKTAPVAPETPYPTYIHTTGSSIELAKGEEGAITYSIPSGAIDDVECRVEDKRICSVGRMEGGFTVIGMQLGHTLVELYSRHDSDVTKIVHVFVVSCT